MFTIPNRSAANYPPQAIMYETDWDIQAAADAGTGIVGTTVGAVTAQSTPDMTVAVAAGSIRVNAALATITAGNVTLTADATNPRWGLVSASSTGVLSATMGTAAVNPLPPALPANTVALAMVYVPANVTAITNAMITDKRCPVPDYSGVEVVVKDLSVAGLTGAVQGARFVGCTASGSPTSGTFAVGDYIVDQTGQMFVCTVAGTPGTWVAPGSGQYLAGPVTSTALFDIQAIGVTETDVTSMSLAVPATSRPFQLHFWATILANTGTAAAGVICKAQVWITDNANTHLSVAGWTVLSSANSSQASLGIIDVWAPVASIGSMTTYKVRANLAAAAPANWTSMRLVPGYTVGTTPMFFEAVGR